VKSGRAALAWSPRPPLRRRRRRGRQRGRSRRQKSQLPSLPKAASRPRGRNDGSGGGDGPRPAPPNPACVRYRAKKPVWLRGAASLAAPGPGGGGSVPPPALQPAARFLISSAVRLPCAPQDGEDRARSGKPRDGPPFPAMGRLSPASSGAPGAIKRPGPRRAQLGFAEAGPAGPGPGYPALPRNWGKPSAVHKSKGPRRVFSSAAMARRLSMSLGPRPSSRREPLPSLPPGHSGRRRPPPPQAPAPARRASAPNC
jgi:hypothetical protein